MITTDFEYFAPTNLNEALLLLEKSDNKNTKLLAGGQSLLPIMKLGLIAPDVIIDLKRIIGLSEIRLENNELKIGALVRHVDIARSDLIQKVCPILQSAAKGIGHQLIRNRGTIGGSVAHCDPRADYLVVLYLLDARLIIRSLKGDREMSITKFVRGALETALTNEEILTQIIIPRPVDKAIEIYNKFEFGHGDFGLVFVALRLLLEDSKCAKSAIFLSGIEDFPTRLVELESNLEGKNYDQLNLDEAIRSCLTKLGLKHDIEQTQFRKRLAATLLKRSIVQAYGRVSD